LPGDLAHRGYGVDQIVNQLAFGTEGLYGTPTYVSATYIFLFILFGAPRAGRDDPVHRFALGRSATRAPGQGAVVSRTDGHHHRSGWPTCHRPVHHPADEPSPYIRPRRRGGGHGAMGARSCRR
jgi:hypothetical protein